MINFQTRTFEALGSDVPEKFLLIGHSFGGFLASLIASLMPHRIEMLFLISPLANSYNPDTYDPYKY